MIGEKVSDMIKSAWPINRKDVGNGGTRDEKKRQNPSDL